MKKFIERLEKDKAFAKKFNAYLISANSAVKKGSAQIAKQLNTLVQKTIADFAKKNKMVVKHDKAIEKSYVASCKQIGLQLDDMIVKQFKALCKQQMDTVGHKVKAKKKK